MAMAALAVEPAGLAQPVNGSSPFSRSLSPQPPLNATTKRKRAASDDGSREGDASSDGKKPFLNGDRALRDQKALISNYYDVLQRYDTASQLLKRPLPDNAASDAGEGKRRKSSDATAEPSIADRVAHDDYDDLEDLVSDVKRVVKSQLDEIQDEEDGKETQAKDESIATTLAFEAKAHELFRRETNYPDNKGDWQQPIKSEFRDGLPTAATGHQILTVWGMGIRAMPFFSSVPQTTAESDSASADAKPITESSLPTGVTLTRVVTTPPGSEKASRSLTLGELFPSPRNLPPLQPPKAAKTTTKSNVLSFYHPELAEKSKYRINTYFSQNVSAGHYLDYSNAAPSSQIKTRQRERAQSLAGHKPSSTELVMSETEALFRGAFSSFAPSKDDSAAVVSSGQVGRMWWHRVGHRAFDRIAEVETSDDEPEATAAAPKRLPPPGVDDELIEDALNTWDDNLVDPSLDEVLGKKSQADKDMEDVLQDVSDLIETLASFQWNRNLTLPTSQDRQSMDPINGDMLRNASSAHQPSEDETMTYKALEAQLALIVQGLPPYAVARLDSDKLSELNISTKIAVRMDEYRGVTEDDEAARVRPQQQPAAMPAAVASASRPSYRTPSGSSYGAQYGGHYGGPNRAPMPSPQAYAHTPGRPGPPKMYQQRPASSVPVPMQQSQHRPAPSSGPMYRMPNGSYPGYGSQLAKSQTPYGHTNLPQYASGTPTQSRNVSQVAAYSPLAQANSPSPAGYPPAYPAGQQQARTPGYPPYANGSPARTISPHVAAHPSQYSHAPSPQQQQIHRPPYGAPPHQGMTPNPPTPQPRYYGAGAPGTPTAATSATQSSSRGLTGFATVMDAEQERRLLDQMKTRASVEEAVRRFGEKIAPTQMQQQQQSAGVAGLAGIGLGGNVDMAKLAAARANRVAAGLAAAMADSAKQQMPARSPGAPLNGAMAPAASVSPAPVPSAAVGSPAGLAGSAFRPPPSA